MIKQIIARNLRKHLRDSVYIKSMMYRILWMLPETFRDQNEIRNALKSVKKGDESPVFFVNIGANDGLSGDPLREFIITRHWHGILIEPVPFVFKRLQKAYKNIKGVVCENVAIAEKTEKRLFWHLKQNRVLDPGYDQVGSLDKAQISKLDHKTYPKYEDFLECSEVLCMSLNDLLKKHNVKKVDIFLIDTEGYDAKVIEQIDFASCKPSLIIYEHLHLSPQDKERCKGLLVSNGFGIVESGGNTIASKTY